MRFISGQKWTRGEGKKREEEREGISDKVELNNLVTLIKYLIIHQTFGDRY